MNHTDALATIAEALLLARGNMVSPTFHDIMLAVTQVTPLLDITMDPDAATLQIAAANKLVRRHKWDVGKVVLLKSGFAKQPKGKNNDGPPRGASR